MNQSVSKFINKHSHEPVEVDRLIVSAFISINKIVVKKNDLLLSYIVREGDKDYESNLKFQAIFARNGKLGLSFEELIELFEFVVSPADKVVNGAVYTPTHIRTFILNAVIKKYKNEQKDLSRVKIGDIACGCGGFLFDAAKILKIKTSKTYLKIFKENIFGLDIQKYSIKRTQLLLTLLAVSEGEDRAVFNFNIHQGNALDFSWAKKDYRFKDQKFDIIAGNPPYVGAPNIDIDSLLLLNKWSVTSIGKPDLYIPFFQIALENLNDNGILGYITVNTFFKSLNARSLRSYFSSKGFSMEIIDFAGEQVFRGRSTYTCICIIQNKKSSTIRYVKSSHKTLQNITSTSFAKISYASLNDFDGWLLESSIIVENLTKIQNTGKPLGELFTIRNGFATLRNDIFIFTPTRESKSYYHFSKNGENHKIEKSICVDVVKPNILRSESEISENLEKLIFPYTVNNTVNISEHLNIISEEFLKRNYPFAYDYLFSYKAELAKRDKSKREYAAWYAFGRSQSLTISGYKLLFPYISDGPYFILTEEMDLLFYNGYAIISQTLTDLLIVQKILKSNVFWYYIKYSSKPYGNGFYSLGKNYIKKFGICEFSAAEKELFLTKNTEEEVNRFLEIKYDINLI